MNEELLKIDAAFEAKKIIDFIQETFEEQGFKKAVIGSSGGIDSATSLHLAVKALGSQNVTIFHMPYFGEGDEDVPLIAKSAGIEDGKINVLSIKQAVDAISEVIRLDTNSPDGRIRLGNIAARTRMITLFDFAKKEKALVIGTENRSEELLSYFTRFGDEASDIEPIRHLFKTQVYELARWLKVPQEIIDKAPTAGLWVGQTDEGEFGFSYKEADIVLHLFFDKKRRISEIESEGCQNAGRIIEWVKKNEYKHNTPYTLG